MKYRARVRDRQYPDDSHDTNLDGFDTPEEAFAYAKKMAHETGFTGVDYWAEEDTDPEIIFMGTT
jgi:hypothetical protein